MIQTYRIKCQIKPMIKDADRLIDGEKPEIKVKDSSLHIIIDSKVAGQIVFEEDRLYYLVTPLFCKRRPRQNFK